jgi:hypothetical protein
VTEGQHQEDIARSSSQMNTQSNAAPESWFQLRGFASSLIAATRPLYWSIRRERWESRSLSYRYECRAGRNLNTVAKSRLHISNTRIAAIWNAPPPNA